MNRVHLFELEDFSWFPAVLRDGGTAYLEFAIRVSGHGKALVPPLAAALRATGHTQLVDLCSGGGGPVRIVVDALRDAGVEVTALLTDRYPNPRAFAHAAQGAEGRVAGHPASVDATAVPAELRGFRTLFNAFHHFRPAQARAILADAQRAGQPIAIFEVVSREPAMLLALCLTPLLVTLSLPAWRPFRWPWVLFTWVLPLMQPFILWDGLVSWLRIYSVPELQALVAGLDAPGWTWEIGTLPLPGAPAHATYLVGRPGPA